MAGPQEGSWEMIKSLLLCASICHRLILFCSEVEKVWLDHCEHMSRAHLHVDRYASTDI